MKEDKISGKFCILVGKSQHRRLWEICVRWEDIIRIDLGEVECNVMICFYLYQDNHQWQTYENMLINIWVL
jgi:hypothetical protein